MTSQDDAADVLNDFASGPALEAAEDTARAFEIAGERIASALEKAARSGEFSFNALAESVTRDLARLAINELIVGPLQGAVDSIGKPSAGGSAKPLTVNMNITGASDAASFKRSQGQISSALARAVASGQKYI